MSVPKAYTEFYNKSKSLGINLKQPFYNVFAKAEDIIWGLNQIEMDIYAVLDDDKENLIGDIIFR